MNYAVIDTNLTYDNSKGDITLFESHLAAISFFEKRRASYRPEYQGNVRYVRLVDLAPSPIGV